MSLKVRELNKLQPAVANIPVSEGGINQEDQPPNDDITRLVQMVEVVEKGNAKIRKINTLTKQIRNELTDVQNQIQNWMVENDQPKFQYHSRSFNTDKSSKTTVGRITDKDILAAVKILYGEAALVKVNDVMWQLHVEKNAGTVTVSNTRNTSKPPLQKPKKRQPQDRDVVVFPK